MVRRDPRRAPVGPRRARHEVPDRRRGRRRGDAGPRRLAPGPRAFLDGAGPAAVGAILGASLLLAGSIHESWQWAVLAGAALGLALRRSALLVLLGGAAAGVLISTIT